MQPLLGFAFTTDQLRVRRSNHCATLPLNTTFTKVALVLGNGVLLFFRTRVCLYRHVQNPVPCPDIPSRADKAAMR